MKKRIWKRLFIVLLCLALVGGITVLGINGHMKKSTSGQILSPEDAAALTDVDCILVLGCYVHDSGRPSDMLADRLHRGIELYQSGAAPKLLMSGDHGQKDYNEVKAMKLEAMGKGIPSENIFMDHAGFSTYRELTYYGSYTLQYVFSQFLEGGQTGLRGHLMRSVLDDLAPEAQLRLYAETGQEYFDEWKAGAIRISEQHDMEWIKENQPAIWLLLQMIDE